MTYSDGVAVIDAAGFVDGAVVRRGNASRRRLCCMVLKCTIYGEVECMETGYCGVCDAAAAAAGVINHVIFRRHGSTLVLLLLLLAIPSPPLSPYFLLLLLLIEAERNKAD